MTDPLGNATVYEYDLRGRKSYEGGATYPVRYTYDVFGNLSTLSTTRDPAANLSTFQPFNFSTASWDTTTWLYDEASGALTNKVYADGMGPAYDYTPGGRLFRRTWARGILTEYAYDSWGNLTNIVYSDETPTISIAYDAMGRMASALVDGVSTNLYFHSAYGDLTNEVQNGVSIARSYDCFGRPTGYYLNPVNPVNPVRNVCYSYDAFGRFSSVVAGTNVFEYSRLPSSDLVSGYTSGPFRRAVSYEPRRDLIAAVTNAFGTTLISAFDYANDAAGRRVSRIDTFDGAVTTNTFGYNFRSEVTSAAMGTNSYSYAYDPIGNRLTASYNDTTSTYTANALNQYMAIDDAEPTYDADGNMTSDGSGWHYAWNGENRMVCASNAEAVVTYAYDHRGRMVRKEISRGKTAPQSITYLWDNWNIIRETQTTNCSLPITCNVWGLDFDGTLQGAGGVGGLLAVVRSSPDTINSSPVARSSSLYFPAYDANGNVSEYVATTGTVSEHYEYSVFGYPIGLEGGHVSSFTHQFGTKPYCAISGFSEYQMRKYIPNIGRWISCDPMSEPGGVFLPIREMDHALVKNCNGYLFMQNSSQNFTELFGLESIGNVMTDGVPTRGIMRHDSFLTFNISCPKCEKVSNVRLRGKIDVVRCIAARRYPKDTQKQKEFEKEWMTANVSDLDGSWVNNVKDDGTPVTVRASMRTRFAGRIFGNDESVDCYSKLGVSYDCVSSNKGKQ